MFFHYYLCVSIIQSMKKETTIDNNIKQIKVIIEIVVGILAIITFSIDIGISFGRNAVISEMNKTVTQSTYQTAK